jgi:hypothetical protein
LELLDLAFRYVLGDARGSIAVLAAIALSPMLGLAVCARAVWHWSWWQVWVLTFALGAVTSGVFTVASGRLLFERTLDVRRVLRDYAARLPAFVSALVASRALIALGSLIVIPGFLAWMRYAYIAEAVLLEQVPVRRALSRSALLSREGNDDGLGPIVATLLFSCLIALAFEAVTLAVLKDVLAIPIQCDTVFDDGGSYFALGGYCASVPWAAASRFLTYIDGRTRQDGWDVQVRLMALGGESK